MGKVALGGRFLGGAMASAVFFGGTQIGADFTQIFSYEIAAFLGISAVRVSRRRDGMGIGFRGAQGWLGGLM